MPPRIPKPKAGANHSPAPPTFESSLDELTFRGIAVPLIKLDTSFSQSHAIHKPVDRDGAYVETTGRDETHISGTANFSNHIFPGESSTWTYGTLFPAQYNKFLNACRDRSIGVLKHPLWGQFGAKCIDFKEHIDPQNRSGVIVDFTFVETIKPTFDNVGTVISASATAVAFDTAVEKAIIDNVALPDDVPSFEQMIDGIKGFIDSGALAVHLLVAKVDRVFYELDRVKYALVSAKSNITADLETKAERLYEAAIELRRSLNQGIASRIVSYRVPKDMTIAGLVLKLNNDVATLIKLNPHLVGSGKASQGTIIRYSRLV